MSDFFGFFAGSVDSKTITNYQKYKSLRETYSE